YVFGTGYRELQSNAYLYVQATEVGGTHPALLEGMGHGNCVLANDVPEHREVLGDAGFYFGNRKNGDLAEKMQYLLDHPDEVKSSGKKAMSRIQECYSWDKVTDDYEKLFRRLMRK
ncbi:glycosyltransferase, partial [bacterium]|nr:glycosyltransferase [bacterium]